MIAGCHVAGSETEAGVSLQRPVVTRKPRAAYRPCRLNDIPQILPSVGLTWPRVGRVPRGASRKVGGTSYPRPWGKHWRCALISTSVTFLLLGFCSCITCSAGLRGVAEVLAAQQAEEIMVSKQLLNSLELVRRGL